MLCPKCQYQWEVKGRSNSQNSYYWGVVLEAFFNSEIGYTKDEWHEIIKAKFLSQTDIVKGRTGAVYLAHSKSTTKLDTKEFEELMTQVRQWASIELGIWIPEPNEPPMENNA